MARMARMKMLNCTPWLNACVRHIVVGFDESFTTWSLCSIVAISFIIFLTSGLTQTFDHCIQLKIPSGIKLQSFTLVLMFVMITTIKKMKQLARGNMMIWRGYTVVLHTHICVSYYSSKEAAACMQQNIQSFNKIEI